MTPQHTEHPLSVACRGNMRAPFTTAPGEGERTPWIHVIDSNVGVNYRLGEDKVLSFTLDVFNLFNFQEATRVDEIYTTQDVLPLETPVKAGELTPGMLQTISGRPFTQADVHPGFKQPLQYQPPRQVRFGLRYTF